MLVFSDNKYIQSQLENLITSYETEINYQPLSIALDPSQITENELTVLIRFLSAERKRFFEFTIPGDETNTQRLQFIARRAILAHSAEKALKYTSNTPKINPLKQSLNTAAPVVKAGIQIQKSFTLNTTVHTKAKKELNDSVLAPPIAEPAPLGLDALHIPILVRQLQALDIQGIQQAALTKIRDNPHAFTDGIVPTNLPKGFYFSKSTNSLCYTDTPQTLPNGLAPQLVKPEPIAIPSADFIKAILPSLSLVNINALLNDIDVVAQKNTLLSLIQTTNTSLIQQINDPLLQPYVPYLAKLFIVGGESHTTLVARLLQLANNKKINLAFINQPEVHLALLNPRSIKNLQKLLQLPAEQREWWNTLTASHLKNKDHHFDFNGFFEAFNQQFVARITEKNLTLPTPCPILHEGHFLVTLNRVLDVLDNAANPQEQCLSLANLNWGPTGAHFALTNPSSELRLKQIHACMRISAPEDLLTPPELVYQQLEQVDLDLTPWLYRYIGKFWNKEISLTCIQTQYNEIKAQATWTPIQQNQFIFIIACTFVNKTPIKLEQWNKAVTGCSTLLQSMDTTDRSHFLKALSTCFKFKPCPSALQIQSLMNLMMEFKTTFPDKDLNNGCINPVITFLEHEGFDLFNALQERIQKTNTEPVDRKIFLNTITNFTNQIDKNRAFLMPDAIKLLTKLQEPDLSQLAIRDLNASLQTLRVAKGDSYCDALLSLLSQINLAKSQTIPTIAQIQTLLGTLANLPEAIPADCDSLDKKENWLNNLIINKSLLPGCVLGNGDISNLDGLIVDALVDAVKKRSAILKIDKIETWLRAQLNTPRASYAVTSALKDQLDKDLFPLFAAINQLIMLLLKPNPSFDDVIDKIQFFEKQKKTLLDGTFRFGPGIFYTETKGAYLLSLLLTGTKHPQDDKTSESIYIALKFIFGYVEAGIHNFFNKEQNKLLAKDLDAKTTLSWLKTFNDTHSLTFLFQEELVLKKVLPALKKTLAQLSIGDKEFDNSVLAEAAQLTISKPGDEHHVEDADTILIAYKAKIESITKYLYLLHDFKAREPAQFAILYKQLQTGQLARLSYKQKQFLTSKLFTVTPVLQNRFLELLTQVLVENPSASIDDLDRAINGLGPVFDLVGIETNAQVLFYRMSLSHNIRNNSPFPLEVLNTLEKLKLDTAENNATKSDIIRAAIKILGNMTKEQPELFNELVKETEALLKLDPQLAKLCLALLKRMPSSNFADDLRAYADILHNLSDLEDDKRNKIATILRGFAQSNKDDTVKLPTLLDITQGLGRRTAEDIQDVLELFATPPFPVAKLLATALRAHDSKNLKAYCANFDTNPFAHTNPQRPLAKHFETNRIEENLLSLMDLMHDTALPYPVMLQMARQLTYIETLGYTDPSQPNDFSAPKKLTEMKRTDLKRFTTDLLTELRNVAADKSSRDPVKLELTQLKLLAYLREIYFRTTGLFPNTAQMTVALLSLQDPQSNALLRMKTGEGKSLGAPLLAVLQWSTGGTVDLCTATKLLSKRDYKFYCEPFFTFLGIKSALIESDSAAKDYVLDGINCSTIEDMSLFRLAAKEAKLEHYVQNGGPIHIVLDECDNALLDQNVIYKLVAEYEDSDNQTVNNAEWIYPLARQFILQPAFKNTDPKKGSVWDEEEDVEQFRVFLNKKITEEYNSDSNKQHFMLATTNTQLKQWISASCKAATLVENKHFIVRPIKEKDAIGNEITKKTVCVPLVQSIPKTGCIFTGGLQQALHARLQAERPAEARNISIDPDPQVLSSQSARGLIDQYQQTNGRLIGISGTPGDPSELNYLKTLLGTKAFGIGPYAGDKRINHPPIFTSTIGGRIKAIKQFFNNIKRPITVSTMPTGDEDPVTEKDYEEDRRIRGQARKKWSPTQTPPALIFCENFAIAQKIERGLRSLAKEGYKIQIVTGKESQEELDDLIKKAARVNTITISTAMLAIGVDINPDEHPDGLLLLQVFPDSVRMSTQMAGRTARNGKTGQWQPIYQINPPTDIFSWLMYMILPWYAQRWNEQEVERIQTKIKLEATTDRLYTQAVDRAQQIIMAQMQAWEGLLHDIYPSDLTLKKELYQWRETLLSELNQLQDPNITQDSLEDSIDQFKIAANKLWETKREEKWAAKANQTVSTFTPKQQLYYNYLIKLDFTKELAIQPEIQSNEQQIKAGTKALMHYQLETTIQDKAGAVLSYESNTLTADAKTQLELTQCRQLLPTLIGKLCALYPPAINELSLPNKNQGSSFLPAILNNLIQTVIDQKNRALLGTEDIIQITKTMIEGYQKELIMADSNRIKQLLQDKIKPQLFAASNSLSNQSLSDQFKMQGLVLTFCTLWENTGLSMTEDLRVLKASYGEEIMKRLAEHVMNELSWVNQSLNPIHSLFERTDAKKAATTIYNLAEQVKAAPNDPQKIQALYIGMQEERVKLKNIYLLSVGHTSPLQVITNALNAIDSLNATPHCNRDFQEKAHDTALVEYHLEQFRTTLHESSKPYIKKQDKVWDHLQKLLEKIGSKNKANSIHLIYELRETIRRFSTYEAYIHYQSQLTYLVGQLDVSIKILASADGLKQDYQTSLLQQKSTQLAGLFTLKPEQIKIEPGTDGLRNFIDIQIEDAPLQAGFTSYESNFNANAEKARIAQLKANLATHEHALVQLSDSKSIDDLPAVYRKAYKKLFDLKAALNSDAWYNTFDCSSLPEVPALLQTRLNELKQLNLADWTSSPVDLAQLEKIEELNLNDAFKDTLLEQEGLQNEIHELTAHLKQYDKQINEAKAKLAEDEKKLPEPYNGYNLLKKTILFTQNYSLYNTITGLKESLTTAEQLKVEAQSQLEDCKEQLLAHNKTLNVHREAFVKTLVAYTKEELLKYLPRASKKQMELIVQELDTTEQTCEKLNQEETKKAKYQTRRFFNPVDFLQYEAELGKEKERIPAPCA